MLITLVRTIVLYTLVVVTMRLMGKRQIGQLEPYELVVAILIAELAAVPMQERQTPLIYGFIAIVTLLFIQVSLSLASLKSQKVRAVVDGRPTIVIRDGKIREEEIRQSRYNLNELLEQLRIQGYFNIRDVEIAVLETGGELSVVPKSQKRPVTPQDMGLDTSYEGLSVPLVMDGRIQLHNLALVKLTEDELLQELKKHGVNSISDVLLATLDTEGRFYVQPHSTRNSEMVK